MDLVSRMCGAGQVHLVDVECRSHLRLLLCGRTKGETVVLDDAGVVARAPRIRDLSAYEVRLIVAAPFRGVVGAVAECRGTKAMEVEEVLRRREVRSPEGETGFA